MGSSMLWLKEDACILSAINVLLSSVVGVVDCLRRYSLAGNIQSIIAL